jgi:hypothetical protein
MTGEANFVTAFRPPRSPACRGVRDGLVAVRRRWMARLLMSRRSLCRGVAVAPMVHGAGDETERVSMGAPVQNE